MKISDLKIGDKFKTYSDLDNKMLLKCVYVGKKIVPNADISDSNLVDCFIAYDNHLDHPFYANESHEVEKVDFDQAYKIKFDSNIACHPYVKHKLITECNGVYIAHNSPEQLLKYKINNFNVRHVDFSELGDNVKINWI